MTGRTFEPDRRVRIFLHGGGNGLLDLLLVVVALDVVAIFVNQGRVATYDGSLVACQLCNLLVCRGAHGRGQAALVDEPRSPFQLVAAVRCLIDRRVGIGICSSRNNS